MFNGPGCSALNNMVNPLTVTCIASYIDSQLFHARDSNRGNILFDAKHYITHQSVEHIAFYQIRICIDLYHTQKPLSIYAYELKPKYYDKTCTSCCVTAFKFQIFHLATLGVSIEFHCIENR